MREILAIAARAAKSLAKPRWLGRCSSSGLKLYAERLQHSATHPIPQEIKSEPERQNELRRDELRRAKNFFLIQTTPDEDPPIEPNSPPSASRHQDRGDGQDPPPSPQQTAIHCFFLLP
jgi:hypothetical protein